MYVLAVDHQSGGKLSDDPLVTLAIWAPCDGAVLRVFEHDLEADSALCVGDPPPSLLPNHSAVRFGELKALIPKTPLRESATYRMTDGAFVARVLRNRPWEYYFRGIGGGRSGANDPVFIISHRLAPRR